LLEASVHTVCQSRERDLVTVLSANHEVGIHPRTAVGATLSCCASTWYDPESSDQGPSDMSALLLVDFAQRDTGGDIEGVISG
jgi:hypothetical protein